MDSFIIEILPFIILAILFAGRKNKKKPATEGMPPFPAPAGSMTMKETPPPIPEPTKEKKKKRAVPPPPPEAPRRTTTDSANDPTQVTANEAATNNEFTIHSNDEARKAIVWGEILRRKY